MGGGLVIFLVVQLLLLAYAMFVTGRSCLVFYLQAVPIILLFAAMPATIIWAFPDFSWYYGLQLLVFGATLYVLYKHRPSRT